MNFPRRVGITEIYCVKPKFLPAYLDDVIEKTTSYFPPNFLRFRPLESISIDSIAINKEKAFSLLSSLRKENNLDRIVGLSSDVLYFDKKSKEGKKVNEANIKEKIAICGNERPPKVIMPRLVAHEFAHLEGLSHELSPLYRKVFLTLAKGFRLEGIIEFAEKESLVDFTNLRNTLMVNNLEHLEEDRFSEKDYGFFEKLMKEDRLP